MTHTKKQKIRILAEGGIMVALATILSFIKIFEFPWGGSITLFSMLPIIVFALRYGVIRGLGVSFVFSLIQFGQGIISGIFGWGLTVPALIACILIDYIFAFSVIGLAGMFGNRKIPQILGGIAIALSLRYLLHVVSGVVIFHSFGLLWEGLYIENSWLYSMAYNACYMLPEVAMTFAGAIVIFRIPAVRRLLLREDRGAAS